MVKKTKPIKKVIKKQNKKNTTKKTAVNKKETNTKQEQKKIKFLNFEIDYKIYFEYFIFIVFFLFAILFISIIIIIYLAIFGSKYLWGAIPLILLFWVISYLLSIKFLKINFFKK